MSNEIRETHSLRNGKQFELENKINSISTSIIYFPEQTSWEIALNMYPVHVEIVLIRLYFN